MPKIRRAEIADIWAEKARNRDITWARVARDINEDYKYICDLINDARIAKQVIVVKKLDRYFKTEDLDIEKYLSEKLKQTVEEFQLK